MQVIFIIALILLTAVGIYHLPTILKYYARLRYRDPILPTEDLPLDQDVTIYLNDKHIPYIKAETDHDLAFSLALIHAQYRLPQIELSRLIAKGELSTVFGAKAQNVDHTLRILQFGKAADEIIAAYPPETRKWLQDYLDGLNYYIENVKKLPWDFSVMHMKPKSWTMQDLVSTFRMASADVNWIYLAGFIREMKNPEWEKVWKLFIEYNQSSIPSEIEGVPSIQDLIMSFTESGSNSLVIAGSKTKSGAAMIASDPHVSVFLPNLWFVCGIESPSYHAVGLSVPGIPLINLGRNEDVAWGATNMYSISSYLYSIDKNEKIKTREEKIPTRLGKEKTVTIRETQYGPIISDSTFFETDQTLSLYWMGHQCSDEVTTFMKVLKSKNWDQFQSAFHNYRVLGLNYLYADKNGNIGYVPAFSQPINKSEERKLWYPQEEFGSDIVWQQDLSRISNPKQGYLASSNNRPVQVKRDWGWFYAPNDRLIRMSMVIESLPQVSLEDLKKLHLDVHAPSATKWIRWIYRNVDKSVQHHPTFQKLLQWDNAYDAEKIEPLLFEFFLFELSNGLLHHEYKEEASIRKIQQSTFMKEWIEKKTSEFSLEERSKIFFNALEKASEKSSPFQNWGEFHQMRLQYLFGYVPWIGKMFHQKTYPVSGGADTLYKRSFVMKGKPTYVTYGSNARHISDMSDIDANYFVIYGGQNGYAFSTQNADQVDLWESGEYIQVPLRIETVKEQFKTVIKLQSKK